MKNLLRIFVFLAQVIVAGELFGYSAYVNGVKWGYKVNDSTAIITDYYTATGERPAISQDTKGVIVVPEKLGGYPVVELGRDAFLSCTNLTGIIVHSGVTSIGSFVFCNCTSLKSIVFNGNAPSILYEDKLFYKVPSSCTIYVMPSSTGWGVTIPGKWYGQNIDYMKCVKFDANGGTVTAEDRYFTNGEAVGALPTPIREGYTFDGWFTAADRGVQVFATTTISANATYYAHWTANEYTIEYDANGGVGTMDDTKAVYDNDYTLTAVAYSNPYHVFMGWATEKDGAVVYEDGANIRNITSASNDVVTLYAVWGKLDALVSSEDGTEFCGESYTVDLSCSLYGATIYYTTNGVTPRLSVAFEYTEPIVIYGSANIVAIAVKDGVRSDYMRVSIVQITPDEPEISPSDGTEFRSETCEVTISCATDGAEIYYTLDGSTPQKENGIKYTEPFTIGGTTTVKAIAVGGPFKSEVVTATISKRSLPLAEAAGMLELTFDTDENAPWRPIVDASAESGFAAQSGAIGKNASTWMGTTVRGAGEFSFRWRVECEEDDSGYATWDRLMVFTNGIEAARIDGVKEWLPVTFAFGDNGKHTVRWEFIKDDFDEENAAFSDSGWVSGVSWVSDDPIPEIEEDSELPCALSQAHDKVRLLEKIPNSTEYMAFRNWVDGKGLSHSVVADSPNAWVSYALDSPGLMAKDVALASDDIEIESIAPSDASDGVFELVVGIGDEKIGENARLAEALGVEGATELDESAFSSEGLDVVLERTADGKAKATVAPIGEPSAFCMRVRVK